ncbi:hypothetical protein SEA_PANAMAXUS_78 [Mycobacterium phage Panamaxus]|uniref:Uncharacterized protein n=1 Tax=Mycobacterium phage Veracruz TaxID=2530154 RepID=A0A481VSW7_9CAUD|nr:hypothetical protein KIP27_gp14 [Mycobacterium phage Veracruz]ALA11882.1 hypothetical protein SEA_TEXAGE_79 [Mycobacterium phage Texage]AOT25582.1 hypothetical protein SEA_MARGO_81 [Mycobacterium phage Margo]AUX82376.1 hypothetical protein SEA_LAMBERT1_81 [Mycobacterium phage Lambert1]AVP42994.1 hypothetical protein SEA_PANAMAXUS_78 [Mycobacterium phage Panamaxus]AWY03612.1 hypothetical protein SEA_HOOKMOUNT_81 [Mycobacterium phage Hookmount]AZV00643.1 hypothetical protein SEA_NORBERT_77 [
MSRRYMHNRRRPSGSRWMNLHFPGTCKLCGEGIAAGQRAYWDARHKNVTCTRIECAKADGLTRQEWAGSPVSGRWVDVLAETRIGPAALPRHGAVTIRTNSGAVLSVNARGRCEDAPCCGCCT